MDRANCDTLTAFEVKQYAARRNGHAGPDHR